MLKPPINIVEDLQSTVNRLNFLHRISQKISEKKPLNKLLFEIMESSKLLLDAEASSLLLYDDQTRRLHFSVATGVRGKAVKAYSVEIGEGIAGWVAKNKKSLLIEDCYQDSRFNPDYDKKSKFRTRSMLCVPLQRKRQLLGVIQVINKKNGDPFDENDQRILETMASQCSIAIENARLIDAQVEAKTMEYELETARNIQQKLLPSALPVFSDIDVAAKLIPAKQVGGDYFNIFRLSSDHTLFLVADVAGKGIPAALIVSTIYSYCQTILKIGSLVFDLTSFVEDLNKVLIESTTVDKYATCWFGLYDHRTGTLDSINAGHNPSYIFRKDAEKPEKLQKGGIFLGSLPAMFEVERVKLEKDDILVFYSDGVTEAWNLKEDEFGEHGLITAINENRTASAEVMVKNVIGRIKLHVGRAPQSDDITLGIVKINLDGD